MKFNTINKKEIEKFTKIADEWWDPKVNSNLCINLIPYE